MTVWYVVNLATRIVPLIDTSQRMRNLSSTFDLSPEEAVGSRVSMTHFNWEVKNKNVVFITSKQIQGTKIKYLNGAKHFFFKVWISPNEC